MLISRRAGYKNLDDWHRKLGSRRHHVCRVDVLFKDEPERSCTGFLVAPDIVLTTYHGIHPPHDPEAPTPESIRFRFDYWTHKHPWREFGVIQHGWLIASSPTPASPSTPDPNALDYALLRVNGQPGLEQIVDDSDSAGSTRGWINFLDRDYRFELGEPAVILQHPDGGPLQIALSSTAIVGVDEPSGRISYNVDTSPGSSGAPCFNSDLDLMALHIGSSIDLHSNQGVTVNAILRSLQDHGLEHLITRKAPDRKAQRKTYIPAVVDFEPDPGFLARIAEGENETTEFKQSALRHPTSGEKDGAIRQTILHSVAGLMNQRGGVLLIGIANDGKATGIDHEYPFVNHKNWDGYELYLRGVLDSKLSLPGAFRFYKIRKYRLSGKDVCCIVVDPTDDEVYVEKKLWLRTGNQTKELTGPDLAAYIKTRNRK